MKIVDYQTFVVANPLPYHGGIYGIFVKLTAFLIQESIEIWGGFHAYILKKPIQWEDRYFLPSTEPGLGVDLDKEGSVRHPYNGDGLILTMMERPAA